MHASSARAVEVRSRRHERTVKGAIAHVGLAEVLGLDVPPPRTKRFWCRMPVGRGAKDKQGGLGECQVLVHGQLAGSCAVGGAWHPGATGMSVPGPRNRNSGPPGPGGTRSWVRKRPVPLPN